MTGSRGADAWRSRLSRWRQATRGSRRDSSRCISAAFRRKSLQCAPGFPRPAQTLANRILYLQFCPSASLRQSYTWICLSFDTFLPGNTAVVNLGKRESITICSLTVPSWRTCACLSKRIAFLPAGRSSRRIRLNEASDPLERCCRLRCGWCKYRPDVDQAFAFEVRHVDTRSSRLRGYSCGIIQ